MRFADIYGHEDVKQRLREMVDRDQIPNTLLLEGPAGSGKFMLARAMAQYIHCSNRTADGDSCGVCPSCRNHAEFNHIDTTYSFPYVKPSSTKAYVSEDYIEEFRSLLTDYPYMDFDMWRSLLGKDNAQPMYYVDEAQALIHKLGFMSRLSKYKVALMWLPERMNVQTANKLLKLIEEPYDDTKIIMVSNRPTTILPTVYSRAQRVIVRRYTDEEVAEILQTRGIDAQRAAELSRMVEGNVNDAIRLEAMSEERSKFFELFVGLMRKAYARNVAELKTWSTQVHALGREQIMNFVDYCSRLIRESFLVRLADSDLSTMTDVEYAFVAKFFPFINERNVEDMIKLFDEARRDIASNGNAKIIFFDLAVRVIILIRRK